MSNKSLKRFRTRSVNARRHFRPLLEVLEDRLLLSVNVDDLWQRAEGLGLTSSLPSFHASNSSLSKTDPIGSIVGSELASVYAASLKADPAQSFSLVTMDASSPLVHSTDGMIAIEAVAKSDASALRSELESLGLVQVDTWQHIVSGFLPVAAIDDLAVLSSLQFARPVYRPITHIGSVTSQGDVAMNSDDARSNFGLNGTGITVGVLSDSYNALGGASSGVSSGDLPGTGNPNGFTTPVNIVRDSATGTDEGRAMLELIHDVAPGANLAFADALMGEVSFANRILDLAAAGADVIVDDIGYFAEPFFQDGIVAQAVDSVVASGVAYFSSAGNSARASYEKGFNNSGVDLGPSGANLVPFTFLAHDFDPGAGQDLFQRVTFPPGETIISFQWSNPFFSVSGGAGAATDMDIALFSTGGSFLFGSFDANVGGDPVEILIVNNNGPTPASADIAIGKFSGLDPSLTKYISFRSSFSINQFATDSSTSYGHPNAAGAQAVGAASYSDTPAFGTSPPVLESFSSAGGTPILFNTSGTPIPQVIRQKPEIVAPDNSNTSFFVSGFDFEPDGFPNFPGTSAAAPHAAAVAALMLQAAGGTGSLTPSQIYGALESTAIDMLAPGFDFDSGFGLIDANAAVTVVSSSNTAIGETGTTTLNQNWKTIPLVNSYTDPVVIAQPPSFTGIDPSTIRIRNVTSNSFQMQIDEWEYLDGNHVTETVSYLVVEKGAYVLSDGTVVHAGTVNANQNFTPVSFPKVFDAAPVVLSQSQTLNGATAIVTRQQSVTKNGFEVRVQEEEAQDGLHSLERIGYVALEAGSGAAGGTAFVVGQTGTNVTNAFKTISFGATFSSPPLFLASMQTFIGVDPAGLRYRNLTAGSVDVFVEEEQSLDSETGHVAENVGFAAFAGATTLVGQSVQPIGEAGQRSVNHDWQTVTLTNSYSDPVVIAQPPSFVGIDPSTVRIRNITSNSFQMQIDEWDYLVLQRNGLILVELGGLAKLTALEA